MQPELLAAASPTFLGLHGVEDPRFSLTLPLTVYFRLLCRLGHMYRLSSRVRPPN